MVVKDLESWFTAEQQRADKLGRVVEVVLVWRSPALSHPLEPTVKIYLASSWRNTYQADALAALRAADFEVYDFKNPAPGNTGFGWKACDPDLMSDLTVERMRRVLAHPVAQIGFGHDIGAMRWADACVLLLPCGMSAHLEAGWMCGAGKPVVVLAPEIREPELMYKCFDTPRGFTPLFATVAEVVEHIRLGGL